MNTFLLNLKKVQYQDFPKISGRILIKGRGKITIGSKVSINSSFDSNPVGMANRTALCTGNRNAKINIGDQAGISNALIFAFTQIDIGEGVLIGGGCQILDSDFHSLNYQHRISKPDPDIKTKAVNIKKGAFIGANSIVLKGVTIGEYSIVAAGSVVTKNIPDNEIWGGNPARFISTQKPMK